jgi:hypothetical protein
LTLNQYKDSLRIETSNMPTAQKSPDTQPALAGEPVKIPRKRTPSRTTAPHSLETEKRRKPAAKKSRSAPKVAVKRSSKDKTINLTINLGTADSESEDNWQPEKVIPAMMVPVRPSQKTSTTRKKRTTKSSDTLPRASANPFLDEIHSAPEPVANDSSEPAEVDSARHGRSSRSNRFRATRRQLATAGITICVFLCVFLFWVFSHTPSTKPDSVATPLIPASEEAMQSIERILSLAELGDPSNALNLLRSLEIDHPGTPSLDYIAALLALQAGDPIEADRRARSSIAKNELVSDALVLQSKAGSGNTGDFSLRDSKIVRLEMLKQAVRINPANPFPMIELAGQLRAQGRKDEALGLLKGANRRLHPIDTHVVVRTTLLLADLESRTDAELPAAKSEGPLPEMFASVYISLRRGRTDLATQTLEKCRIQSTPDLFEYILGDPAFASYRGKDLAKPL